MSRSLTDSWTLGGIEVENRLVLAPLAGIGNWFVRLQAKRHGAGLVVSEMVSSFGLKHGNEQGGVSGEPAFELSNIVVRALKAQLGDAVPIIGVGGIMSGRDAAEKVRLGAQLVQLYTGLIYQGPALVRECAEYLRKQHAQA